MYSKGVDDMETQKVGLVLEGGGMRGMYTAGVLDVFLQENIWPDAIEVNSASEAGEYTSQFWEEKK